MIDLDNQSNLSIDIIAIEKIASFLSSKEIELIITDDNTMQSINHEHRGKDYSTDVLSFPLDSPFIGQNLLGSIVISESFVTKKAILLGHSIQDEFSLLFIHGMLHLLGFDHETDDGEMRQKEKKLIEAFDLPKSLIVRTEEY
jgi:probable rRNA maturation factor